MDTPQGVALTISPDPGTTAKHNDEVTVTLSKGPMPVTMPNIVGKTQDEMQAALGELKLTANVTEQYDDKVEAGQVISASQEAGAQLKWGDSVDVVISKGPEMATIPSGLVGKQESAVTKTLEGLGFEVKTDKVLGGLFGHGTYREKWRYGPIQRRQDSLARCQRQPHRHHPHHRVRFE